MTNDLTSYTRKYDGKFKYAIIISLIMHTIIYCLLYKQFFFSNKTPITTITAISSKETTDHNDSHHEDIKYNQNERLKVANTNTQRHATTEGHSIPYTHTSKKQNNLHQNERLKVANTNTQRHATTEGHSIPYTHTSKKQNNLHQNERLKVANTNTQRHATTEGHSIPYTHTSKKQNNLHQNERLKVANTNTQRHATTEGHSIPYTHTSKKQNNLHQNERLKVANTNTQRHATTEGHSIPYTHTSKKQNNLHQNERLKVANTNTQRHATTEGHSIPYTHTSKKQNNLHQNERLKVANTNTQRHATTEGHSIPYTHTSKKQNNLNTEKNKLIKFHTDHSNTKDADVLKNLLNTIIDKPDCIENNKTLKLSILQKESSNNSDIQNNDIHNHEIEIYKNMIVESIQQKFFNASSYFGKECNLKIQLAPNGQLISVIALSGDTLLCNAAIVAVKLANIPSPPNMHVYEIFKNTILNFSF